MSFFNHCQPVSPTEPTVGLTARQQHWNEKQCLRKHKILYFLAKLHRFIIVDIVELGQTRRLALIIMQKYSIELHHNIADLRQHQRSPL